MAPTYLDVTETQRMFLAVVVFKTKKHKRPHHNKTRKAIMILSNEKVTTFMRMETSIICRRLNVKSAIRQKIVF